MSISSSVWYHSLQRIGPRCTHRRVPGSRWVGAGDADVARCSLKSFSPLRCLLETREEHTKQTGGPYRSKIRHCLLMRRDYRSIIVSQVNHHNTLWFSFKHLSPTLTLFEEPVGVESVSCTGTCVPSVQTGGHFLFPRPIPHILLFLITGSTMLSDFLLLSFLIVFLLLCAISYGSFLIFSKV